ncbi:MAG: YCF48-related protein [bacterium]
MNSFQTVLALLCFAPLSLCLAQGSWKVLEDAPVASGRFDDVYFVTPDLGWIVSVQGTVYRTDDGGETWERQFFSPGAGFRSVGFADSLRGWIGALSGPDFLWQTTDGGTTWSAVPSIQGPAISGICGMCVVNDSVVYGAGRFSGPPRLIKTTDGGQRWTSLDLSTHAGTLVDCHFFTPDSGFVVGGSPTGQFPNRIKAVVLFTADGGATFETIKTTPNRPTGPQGEWCWKISFPTRQMGFVSIERVQFNVGAQHILKTTDGGLTWEEIEVGRAFRVQAIGMLTESLGWLGGEEETFATTDGGLTWQLTDFEWANLNRFRFFGDTLGYAVGRTVYKYARDTLATSVDPARPVPDGFALEQNYPNPFNRSTSIGYRLRVGGRVVLQVFNVSGQEVARLVDTEQTPGRYHLTFESSGLPSGVYYYRLRSRGRVETRKLILLR